MKHNNIIKLFITISIFFSVLVAPSMLSLANIDISNEFQKERVEYEESIEYEILLPNEYDGDGRNYPVVYLFPDDGLYIYNTNLVDNLVTTMGTENCIDMIFVKLFFEEADDFRAITQQVVEDVDNKYNTIRNVKQRAALGQNVGGYMAYLSTLTDSNSFTINTVPKLFGLVGSLGGDFVSEDNIWYTVEDDIYDIVTQIGDVDIEKFYTYLDGATEDPNTSMSKGTNDIGSLFITFNKTMSYDVHEYTARYGEYNETFTKESVSRVLNRFSNSMQKEMVKSTLSISPQVALSSSNEISATYYVNIGELYNDYSITNNDITITVNMIDPSNGDSLYEEVIVEDVEKGNVEFTNTILLPNLVNGNSSSIILSVELFDYSKIYATQSLVRIQDTGSKPEDQLIDLMGDWYFNAYKNYSDLDENTLDLVSNVTKDIYEKWGIVQPGLGWWTEDFDSSLGGDGNWAGYAWYVREFIIPKGFTTDNLILALGCFDEADVVYINDVEVGATGITDEGIYDESNPWDTKRLYSLDSSILNYDENNTIAIKTCNSSGGGGWYTGPIGIYSQAAYNRAVNLPYTSVTDDIKLIIQEFVELQNTAIINKDIEVYADGITPDYNQEGLDKGDLLEKALGVMEGDSTIKIIDTAVGIYQYDDYYVYQANRNMQTGKGENIELEVCDYYKIIDNEILLYGNNSRFYNETYSSKNAAIAQELTEDMVDMNFLIYLPEDYFETDKRYPVVYLLHQFGSTSNSYAISNVNKIFDEIINDGDMREMIVVCPDSSLMSWWRGSWEDMIIEDLVPYINSNYRTIQDARFQGTAGASMGGQGAYSVAFHNPNYFSNVISFFGAFNYGETNSPNHIAKEEMSDFLQYYNQIFVCGNRDVYGFGTFAIELDQILRDKNVEHYFLIENGGHDDAFYIPLFDDSFIYISDSMYTLADDIEDIINLTVSNNTDNNSLSISAEITIDDKISTYFNKIPDSIYTIDTNPSMTIPVMLKVVQNEKVVYSHMDNSKFIKEATSWSITQTLTEWEMRDIDMESPYTISAIVSVLDKNIIVSINDQIDMESDSIEDGESTNSFGISSYMIMIGGVIVLLVISIIVMKKRRFR